MREAAQAAVDDAIAEVNKKLDSERVALTNDASKKEAAGKKNIRQD
jgi:hypothetical protein